MEQGETIDPEDSGRPRWPKTKAETRRWKELRGNCPAYLRSDLELYFEDLRLAGTCLDDSSVGWIKMYFAGCRRFPELWPKFRGALCHLTTAANWEGIQETGEILPSGSGPSNWHGRVPKSVSLALQKRAVALFDLASMESKHFRTGKQALGTIRSLMGDDGSAIWLTLDRTQLVLERFDGTPRTAFAIPYWETHHCGPIPLSAVSGVYLLSRDGSETIRATPWRR